MNIPLVDNKSTTLKMLPVCECGQVIPDLEYGDEVDVLSNGYKHLKPMFQPMVCPNCKRHIESLIIDGKYVHMFMKR